MAGVGSPSSINSGAGSSGHLAASNDAGSLPTEACVQMSGIHAQASKRNPPAEEAAQVQGSPMHDVKRCVCTCEVVKLSLAPLEMYLLRFSEEYVQQSYHITNQVRSGTATPECPHISISADEFAALPSATLTGAYLAVQWILFACTCSSRGCQ